MSTSENIIKTEKMPSSPEQSKISQIDTVERSILVQQAKPSLATQANT